MVARKPLVTISGVYSELPPGDSVEGALLTTSLTAGSGLLGGGVLATNQRLDIGFASNPSGLILVGNNLGLDGVAQRTADSALASGNAALSSAATAQASGNAALSLAATAQASGNAALTSAEAKLPLTGGVLTGDLTLDNQSDVRFREATAGGTNYVGFQAPSSISSDLVWTLPGTDGSNGQVLTTNGSNTLSWASVQGGIQTFTSSGSITAGNAVQINNDGTVSVPTVVTTPSVGAISTNYGGSNDMTQIVYNPVTDRYLAAWWQASQFYRALGTPDSSGGITWTQSAAFFYTTTAYNIGLINIPGTNTVVGAYTDSSGSTIYWYIHTLTSSSISDAQAATTNPSNNINRTSLRWDSATSKLVWGYQQTSPSNAPAVRIGTISGGSIFWTAAATPNSMYGGETTISYDSSSGKYLLIYRGTNNYTYGNVVTIPSSGPATFGSDQLISTDQPSYAQAVYYPLIGQLACALGSFLTTLTVSGDTITRGTNVSIPSYSGYASLVIDPSSGRLIVHGYDANGYPVFYYPTFSGGVFTLGSSTVLISTNMLNAPNNLARQILAVDTSRDRIAFVGGYNQKSLTVKATSASLTSSNFVGFAESTVSTGQSVNVACVGGTNNSQTSLTTGTKYYVTAAGSLTTTTGTIEGGIALSATKILVKG